MRRWLVLISAAFHLVLVFALFVAGFWKLEQLDRPRVSVALAQPLPPPPAPAGGAAPTKAPEFTHKKVVHDPVQPEPKQIEHKPLVAAETPSTGEGSGAGSGNGSGEVTSTSTCTENCGPGEGSGSAAPVVDKKKKTETTVPPDVIRGMRIAGDTQIHPSDVEKTAMARDGKDRVIAVFKTCVDDHGNVASVHLMKTSGYAGYDRALSDAMFGWRYRPYVIGNEPVMACGIVTFIYQVR